MRSYTIREQILDDGMVSELGISHTYRQDTGMYICQASNAFGQDETSIHLIVQEVPEQPKNLRINAQQSRSLQLTWSQPFAGNSPIIEYHIQYKQLTESWQSSERIAVTGTQTVVNIIALHPAKAYHIRMAAENKLGSSEFSEVVHITTLEEVPSGPPQNVRGEPRSSSEIFVTWDAPDKDEWNGNLLGYYVGYQMLDGGPTAATADSVAVLPTQGFNFKTVEVRSHFGGETLLQNLNKFTQYNIVVQAYTSQGSGPPSKEILVNSLEDGGCIRTVSIFSQCSNNTSIPFQFHPVRRRVPNAMCSAPRPSTSRGRRHRPTAKMAKSRATRWPTLQPRSCSNRSRTPSNRPTSI